MQGFISEREKTMVNVAKDDSDAITMRDGDEESPMGSNISLMGRFLWNAFSGESQKGSRLHVRLLFETSQHMLQPALVETNHNIIARRDDGDASSP